ncbi:MAG: DUF2778 domain-containing protein [Gammaproteobacteria bacterium]|nr:DUF2778 domain-containing protein [Gammaproteobacteria bacterium]
MDDLKFDGKILTWSGRGSYRATTGMIGFQKPEFQCVRERGPVPEGNYYIPLIAGDMAKDDGEGICQLAPSWQIQQIPRGDKAGGCEPYWANWGFNRVRFEPADKLTKHKCDPKRSGFYLHDSTKGFSHGCIEVEQKFFNDLRNYLKITKNKKLSLSIKYTPGMDTNGGTKK